jgi:hypothetical protein
VTVCIDGARAARVNLTEVTHKGVYEASEVDPRDMTIEAVIKQCEG